MLFEGKYERSKNLQEEQNRARRGTKTKEGHKTEEELTPADIVEKGDIFAMIISAMILILPIAFVSLIIMCGVMFFLI